MQSSKTGIGNIREYEAYDKMLIAVDCIILGFDGKDLKALLVKKIGRAHV